MYPSTGRFLETHCNLHLFMHFFSPNILSSSYFYFRNDKTELKIIKNYSLMKELYTPSRDV